MKLISKYSVHCPSFCKIFGAPYCVPSWQSELLSTTKVCVIHLQLIFKQFSVSLVFSPTSQIVLKVSAGTLTEFVLFYVLKKFCFVAGKNINRHDVFSDFTSDSSLFKLITPWQKFFISGLHVSIRQMPSYTFKSFFLRLIYLCHFHASSLYIHILYLQGEF